MGWNAQWCGSNMDYKDSGGGRQVASGDLRELRGLAMAVENAGGERGWREARARLGVGH